MVDIDNFKKEGFIGMGIGNSSTESEKESLKEKIKRWRKEIGIQGDTENAKIKELEFKLECTTKYRNELKAQFEILSKLLLKESY